MAKAVSYLRYSSSAQGSGSTIQRQQEMIDRWLVENPEIERSPLSRIDEGKSAYKKIHLKHGLGAIIDAIQEGEIEEGDYLLIEAIDRLGRFEPLEMVTLVTKIVTFGITIVTLEDSQQYSAHSLNNDHSQLFILSGKVQQAHEYSKRLSTRISAANKRKRENAKEGKTVKRYNPIWLTGDGKLKPSESVMIRDCIKLFKKGLGARAIILKLKKKHSHLETVHPTTLKRWFSNSAIKGDWIVKKGTDEEERIKGVFEPLITPEEFASLQGEIKHRHKYMSPPKQYPLAQIVSCGECGKNFHYRRKNYKDYTIIYANCTTYLKRGKSFCSNNKTWPHEVLQHVFYETCENVLLDAATRIATKINDGEIEAIELEVSDTNNRIAKLEEAIQISDDVVSLVASRNKRISERDALLAKIAATESEISSIPIEYSQRIYENYFQLHEDPNARRELLIKLGYKLVILGNKIEAMNSNSTIASYELVKRSQKNGCYFIKKERDNKSPILYAINRFGAFAKTTDTISWEQFGANIDDYLTTSAQDSVLLSPSGDQLSISDIDPDVKSENWPIKLTKST